MTNEQSLILYLEVFIWTMVFSHLYQKSKKGVRRKITAILTLIPITALHAFRYDVGTDWSAYYDIFYFIGKGEKYFLHYLSEPIYYYENILVYKIFKEPYAVFIINAIVIEGLFFLTLKYYKKYISMPLAYMMYLSTCFPMMLNAERQAVAMAFIWYASRYINEKKFLKYLIFVIMASMYHNSALICIGLYGINMMNENTMKRKGKYVMAVLTFLFLIMYKIVPTLLINNISLLNKYAVYLTYKPTTYGVFIYNILYSIPILLFFRSYTHDKNYDIKYIFFVLIFYWMHILGTISSPATRLTYFIEIWLILLAGKTYMSVKRKENKIIYFCLYAVIMLVSFYRTIYIGGGCEIFPYRSIFTNR